MSKTKIEWTDLTINPIVGCSKCSPGCENCYAEKRAVRLKAMGLPQYQDVVDNNGWTGKTAFVPSAFNNIPRRGHKKIFIGSMTDIFHESIPENWIYRIIHTIMNFPQHTFIILTKRPERMKSFFDDLMYPSPANLWLGVTVCNQEEADRKIPLLLQTPAAVHFVSIEPMLGAVDLKKYLPPPGTVEVMFNAGSLGKSPKSEICKLLNIRYLDWVICGGESGSNARVLDPRWVISLRGQCEAVNVPLFFKQWGEYKYSTLFSKGKPFLDPIAEKVGKKKAGNMILGKKYEEFPEVKA